MMEPSGEGKVLQMFWDGFPELEHNLQAARTHYFRTVVDLLNMEDTVSTSVFLDSALENVVPVHEACLEVMAAPVITTIRARYISAILATEIDERNTFYARVTLKRSGSVDHTLHCPDRERFDSPDLVSSHVQAHSIDGLIARFAARHFQDVDRLLELGGVSPRQQTAGSTIGVLLSGRRASYDLAATTSSAEET